MDSKKTTLPQASTATPENTPLPGGGSWHWDTTAAAWAENLPPDTSLISDVATTTVVAPITEINPE